MRVESSATSTFRFDEFEVDPQNRELRKGGTILALQPHAFELLVLFVSRANQLITRDELKRTLWAKEVSGDFDSRLNFHVRNVRRVLGDDPENPRYVQTVPKSGYKFIAPLQLLEPRKQDSTASDGVTKERSWRLRRAFALLSLTVLMLAAFAAVFAIVQHFRSSGAVASTHPNQIEQIEAALQSSRNNNILPIIASVTPILPKAKQTIVISGRAFGSHTSFQHLDTPFLAIRDQTSHWAAGRITPENSDEVTIDVASWNDWQIVIAGFTGAYGTHGWELNPGDEIELVVWNCRTGNGPASYHLRVSPSRELN